MPEERARKSRPRSPFGAIPRFGDLIDVTDEMIAFVEKYQQVWKHESRAMLALGEFLGARSDSLRAQVELMRMGSGTARRYAAWSDALLAMRPEAIVQAWMQAMPRTRTREKKQDGE
ncbi:MAG: hypothetical protein ACYDEB_12480 [Dehalococcoidia bacterium]